MDIGRTLECGLVAHAICTFLAHEETKRPLGVSIQAPWGGGKTSIMRMLQNKFDPEGYGLHIQKEKSNNNGGAAHITVKDLLERLDSCATKRKAIKISLACQKDTQE